MSRLDSIRYITLPKSMEEKITGFAIDSSIPIPVQLPDGHTSLDVDKVTLESIVAGMLVVIAYKENDRNIGYYRDFVLAAQPNAVEELNTAAIAKEHQKDYPFAEQLFLTVYHMLPQSASCINLATLYSSWAVYEKDQKDDKAEEFYLTKCLNTLEDGLERFGENEDILAELGSLHTYLGNLEEAQGYLERYMKVAEDGEKRQKLKKMLKDVTLRLDSDQEIRQAYDFMMLDEEDKALEAIEKFESNADIYNELSICALEKGDRELAKSYLDTAVDLDEDNLTLASNLAFLHLMDDEFDEAKEWIEKCRLLAPEDRQVKAMMEEYSAKTGEEFGQVVRQEYVHDPSADEHGHHHHDDECQCDHDHHHGDEDDDDGYAEELAAMAEDEETR